MSKAVLPLFLIVFIFASVAGATEEGVVRPSPPPSQNPRWTKRVIPIHLSKSLRQLGEAYAVEGAVIAALRTWEDASRFSFVVVWTDAESASSAQSRGDRKNLITVAGVSENILMFSGDASQDAARTRVFTDRRGNISEADIVLNPYQQFSTQGTFGSFDLQSVVAHEVGHLLGLGHSPVIGATMFDQLAMNGTFGATADSARSLSMDDVTALRSVYSVDDAVCCGTVSAQIDSGSTRTTFVAWLEEESTGRVVAGRYVDRSGSVRLGGLEDGEYILRFDVAGVGAGDRYFDSDSDIRVTVRAGDTVPVRAFSKSSKGVFGSPMLGTDSRFSSTVYPVSRGIEGRVIIGAPGTAPVSPKVSFTSPFFSIIDTQIFGGLNTTGLMLLGIDFNLEEKAPNGEYTLVLSGASGIRHFLIGGMSVEAEAGESKAF